MKRLLLLFVALCLGQVNAYAQQREIELSAKQMAKAEKLITRIEHLDTVTTDDQSSSKSQSLVRKLASAIRLDLSELPDGDIKTDLSTALLFYEREAASSSPEQSHVSHETCEEEKPGAYRKLCETTQGGARQLRLNKARLHTRWAQATIARQKGSLDATAAAALSEMESEREFNRKLAEGALSALTRLDNEVRVYRTLGEFTEGRALARVSFEKFNADLEDVRRVVRANLYWMPESRLKNELRNAMSSYLDGCFWWKQVYRPAVVYAGNNYTNESLRQVRLDNPEEVKYTVAINWRQAHQYTARAGEILNRMK